MTEVMAATGLPPGREILRVAGPRIARDALCPLAAFYLGYKLIGLGAGIAFATVVGLGVAALARRRRNLDDDRDGHHGSVHRELGHDRRRRRPL